MAFAAAVHPVPTSPPPARRERSRLAAAAADAVICLFLASMWLFWWALGACHVGLIACGEGCPMAVVAGKVCAAAGFAFTLLLCFGVMPLMAWRFRAAGAGPIDVEAVAVQAPAPKSFAVAMRKVLRDPAVIAVFASAAFVLLLAVGVLLNGDSPVNGSRRERIGSAMYHVGALGMDTVNCFILCPILTVKTWRVFRMA
ncbi:unnamed protein product [Urochloa decumbens]|uniref:Uncharacterized protein n=1 Tax=Urochloa decumbens TaxID=240449 RepID=A0ABC9BIL1_9POAL